MAFQIHPCFPQRVNEVNALGALEPLEQASGRDSADVGYRSQFLFRGRYQRIQCAKAGGQHLPRLLPHLADAEGKQPPGQVIALGPFNGCDEVFRALFAHAL